MFAKMYPPIVKHHALPTNFRCVGRIFAATAAVEGVCRAPARHSSHVALTATSDKILETVTIDEAIQPKTRLQP